MSMHQYEKAVHLISALLTSTFEGRPMTSKHFISIFKLIYRLQCQQKNSRPNPIGALSHINMQEGYASYSVKANGLQIRNSSEFA